MASYTNINVNAMYTASVNMEKQSTIYGFGGTDGSVISGLDTHMLKNTEWGAVAYLSKSNYGKVSEIWINNINTDLGTGYGPSITGCSGSSESADMLRSATCPENNQYNTTIGFNASTTGNVTGIYDMSGGVWEYVMGNLDNLAASSGVTFANIPDKYIDKYSSANNSGYNNTTYGDAYYETSTSRSGATGWYKDYSDAPYSANPWFMHGGFSGDGWGAGAFAFYRNYGGVSTYFGFRSAILVASGL